MDFGLWLNERIPELTRARDTDGHLEHLLNVLGTGFGELQELTEAFVNLVNIDECEARYLPFLGELLGFEFPYDLTEAQQREFVRNAVALYRVKGTPGAMKFMVARIIGNGFTVNILDENHVAKTFTVQIVADNDAPSLDRIQNKISYLINLYSPAGMIPATVIAYFDTEAVTGGAYTDTHTSSEITAWRCNLVGHNCNTKPTPSTAVSVNNSGTLTLAI